MQDVFLELTDENIKALTDKIPQRPMGVVEGTSYSLVIVAAVGVSRRKSARGALTGRGAQTGRVRRVARVTRGAAVSQQQARGSTGSSLAFPPCPPPCPLLPPASVS